ncbi:tetraacyldisaccharide 4'-kinase [Albimonas sp. CAU 1670]|uniref:tetraacyldisaccharide 4'-kinase n=1 Tax=Albimonas sp. CAU 1670 TaxID=3032599 RepID=UPI0023DA3066|nr:tetraacyldisaccharide 4'-kinase [Albimonas sp. CAU 1670]MDF2232579.1 tetraacyldisaccharide 4'-kinase [Albimonas sp. CAU 1670]
MRRAPAFWSNPPERPGWLARLLSPLGRLYALATARRVARASDWRAPVPVICVGNLTAGGAGKTPTVLALLEIFADLGIEAHVLSRGHGGTLGRGAPHRVDVAADRAEETGDEPLLLAAFAPVWVCPDRAAAAKAAVAAGAQALVMDDGFQNPGLAKDFSLVVVDAASGFGNGLPIPAGPLRETVAAGLARAQAALLIGAPAARARLRERWPALETLPLFEGEVRAREIGIDWRGEKVLAFAGIAHPEKFFATLRGLGADLVAAHAFPDHAPFAPRALRRLEAEAASLGARMVTTEKDAVRLPAEFRGKAMPLPVHLRIEPPAEGAETLRTALKNVCSQTVQRTP